MHGNWSKFISRYLQAFILENIILPRISEGIVNFGKHIMNIHRYKKHQLLPWLNLKLLMFNKFIVALMFILINHIKELSISH